MRVFVSRENLPRGRQARSPGSGTASGRTRRAETTNPPSQRAGEQFHRPARLLGLLLPTSPLCPVWPERLAPIAVQGERIVAAMACIAVDIGDLSAARLRHLCTALQIAPRLAGVLARHSFVWVARAHFLKLVEEPAG